MKKIYLLLSLSLVVLLSSGQAPVADRDTVYAGTHHSNKEGETTRGYYFQAKSSFIIKGMMSAEESNPGATRQSVMLVAYGETEPAHWTSPTLSPYTTLFSAINAPAGWVDCNVVIVEGNYYGVMGGKHNEGETYMYNSYRASGNYTVDIEGSPTELIKLAYLGSLAAGAPPSGSFGADPGLNIGRIHLITSPIPEPDCPESIVVDNDPGACGAIVNYTAPSVVGVTVTQIDDSGLTSGDEFPVGTTVQQFEFDFGAGLLDTCSFTITVKDTEAPVLDCPENMVVSNDPGECGAVVTFGALTDEILLDEVLPGSLSDWEITDEEYNPTFYYDEIVSPYDGTTAIRTRVVGNTIMMCETKVITKTYNISGNTEITDLQAYLEFASNLTTYNFPHIIVELLDEDSESLGQHVYYGKDMVGSYFLNTYILANPDNYTELPSATGDMILDLSKIGENIDFNKITIKLLNYTCVGENSIIFDHLRAINGGDGGTNSAVVASDNCPGVLVEASIPSGSLFPIGTTPVTLTATDAAGNTTSCTFNVTVEDTEAPVAVCKGSGTGSAAYVISTSGQPWEVNTNEEAMDMVFGSGNWDQLYYETLDAGTLFSNAYDFIFMEGGDDIANEMEAFVDANIPAMETWVANGGHLFLNAAPNEGDGMNWGFWGVELVYNGETTSTDIAEATNPAHPIFSGPFTPVITGPYYGDSFAHAIIPEELNVTVLMHNVNDPAQYVLSYAEWGSGKVLFGGMTTTNYHSPQPEATNLRANMIDFLSQKMLEFALDETGTVTITPEDINGGSTDNCGIASMELSRTEFTRDDLGDQEVTLTVTDLSGNTSTCTTTVKITGDEEPDVVANPIDVYLDETGRYVLTREDLDEMAAGTTDDSTPFEELELSAYPHIYTCAQLNDEIIHARLTVEDAEGNMARAWTTVTVLDTFPPAFVPVENIEIVLEPGLAESAIDYPVIEVLDNCPLVPELIEGLGPDGIFPVGTTTETWVAEDGGGNTDTLSFTVTIIATNDLPTIDPVADVTTDEDDSPVTVELTGISYGNDLEEQTVTLTAESDNTGLVSAITVNYTSGSTGSLEIELAPDANGTAVITVSVEDSEGGMTTETFTLTVVSVNDAPYLVNPIDDQVVNASYVLKVPVSSELGELFDDADGDELTISAMLEGGDPLPAWAELINDSLVFSPMIEDTGCVNIVVMAADPEGATATDTFQLCVDGYPVSAGQITAGEFNVNLYPNPARDVVNLEIKSNGYGPVDLSVYTITGKLVLRKNFSNNQLVTFSMADHVSGLYFVKLQMDGKLAVKKLVLDRK